MSRVNPAGDPCRQLADQITARRQAANDVQAARQVVSFGEESLRRCPTSYAVKSALAYAIYKAEIQLPRRANEVDIDKLTAAVERIRECMAHGPYHPTSAFIPALADVVMALLRLRDTAARQAAIRLVTSVDIDQVSRVRNGNFPSHAERFLGPAAQALDANPQFREELIAICRLALQPGVIADEADTGWIKFRLAKAIEEHAPDEALALLDGLTSDARRDGMTTLYVRLLRQAGRHEDALAAARSFARNLDFAKLEFAHPVLVDLMELLPGGPVRTSLVVFLQHVGFNKRARGIDPRVVTAAKALGLPAPAKLPDAKLVVMLSDLKSEL